MRQPLNLLLIALVMLMAGCSSRAPLVQRDGPEANPPSGLKQLPDAVPRVESIRKGGPNKPYEIEGIHYRPMTEDKPLVERGIASWYGKAFHGRPTASGETYNMYAMTAAHPTMAIPSYARVRNPANGREVVVRINDRGPFHKGRIIDLSYTAALKLDLLRGVGEVEVERLTYEDIRAGAWRKQQGPDEAPTYVAQPAANAPERETLNPAPRQAAAGFWVQLGAYRNLEGAEAIRSMLVQDREWLAPLLAIFKDRGLNRLQAGPFEDRADAQAALQRLNGVVEGVIVERR